MEETSEFSVNDSWMEGVYSNIVTCLKRIQKWVNNEVYLQATQQVSSRWTFPKLTKSLELPCQLFREKYVAQFRSSVNLEHFDASWIPLEIQIVHVYVMT